MSQRRHPLMEAEKQEALADIVLAGWITSLESVLRNMPMITAKAKLAEQGTGRPERHAIGAELLDTKPSITISLSPLMAITALIPTRTKEKGILAGRVRVKAVEGLRRIKMERAIEEGLLLEGVMEEMVPGTKAVEAAIRIDARRLLLVEAAQKARGPRRTIAFNALMA